jgi:hypothetical protein
MHKRIEIFVRNPGFEETEQAMGVLSVDFEDEAVFNAARGALRDGLALTKAARSIILLNERGEELGFNPKYYVSHRASAVDDWRPTWVLPTEGASAPPRERVE